MVYGNDILNLSKNCLCGICNCNRDLSMTNFCFNCNKFICNQCINLHQSLNHSKLLSSNKFNIKCKKHPNKNYLMYCYDCRHNICSKCIEQKEHLNHHKDLLSEIEPSEEELNNIKELKNEMIKNKQILIEERDKIDKLILSIEQGIELNEMIINTYQKFRFNYIP